MDIVITGGLGFIGSRFVKLCTDKGEHKNDMIPTPSKKVCKWCEFRKTEYCDKGI